MLKNVQKINFLECIEMVVIYYKTCFCATHIFCQQTSSFLMKQKIPGGKKFLKYKNSHILLIVNNCLS